MNECVLLSVPTEEVIISLFQRYLADHNLYKNGIAENITLFSGAIENYLIDHYGLDLEEDFNEN